MAKAKDGSANGVKGVQADRSNPVGRPAARERSGLVVAIGASLAERQSLVHLLADIRAEDAAWIICLRDGTDKESDLLASLGGAALPVKIAADGDVLTPGRAYLVPPSSLAKVRNGKIHLRSPSDSSGRGDIDGLLVSLARDCGEASTAVILAGTGIDGMLGVTAVKEAGGLTIAEAREDGHPAASGTGEAAAIADHVLPVDEIAPCIAHHGHLQQSAEWPFGQDREADIAAELGSVVVALRSRTGHDFQGYKQNTFLRRVRRRMLVTHSGTIEAYAERLRDDPDEAQHLFDDLLIGVTGFFRDKAEFDLLEREVVPKLFEGKDASDQVRVWVLGCATGEEAYSIAMLLREHMAKLDAVPTVQIFATDIDGRALAAARVGRYSAAAVADVPPQRLARWFVHEGEGWSVVKELREMCIFSQHSIVKDAPFSRLDLISCRNLLIYLGNDLQNRIVPLFHFALNPGGFLFLGNSENVTRHSKLFAPLDRRFRVFRRIETAVRAFHALPLGAGERPLQKPLSAQPASVRASLVRRAERVVEGYAPAYVVVDGYHEVLHFSGHTGRYLDPASGAATLNLLNLVHRDLRLDLRAALHKADVENRKVVVERLRMEADGEAAPVSIAVEPIHAGGDEPRSFVVLFIDAEAAPADGGETAPAPSLPRDEHVQRLETELRLTRERLQATIEELESTIEELKSSNEEHQSINEELQSANEELETSKEELQSVNEELQTVNGELAHRVRDLGRANSDLKNLLESTQIATIFLDNDLRIQNFTPAVADIFHVIESDIGRPITHIASRVLYDELADDLRKVMRTLGTVEREVEDPRDKSRFLVRVLPYRSVDNFIAGVVLTFLDVTATATVERALRESEERFRMMARTVPAFLFTAQPDLAWDYVNPRFYEYTGLQEGAGLGDGWLAAVHPDDVEENQLRWHRAAETGATFEMTFRMRGGDGAYRWFLGRAEPMYGPDGAIDRWFGSINDVHEHRIAEDRQRLLMAELQHRVKNILAVVRSVFGRTVETRDTLDEVSMHFEGRLDALARAQNVLIRTPEGGLDLEEFIRDELLNHGAQDGENLEITGPPVRLRARAAEIVGLVVHELATNAAKYGALSRGKGQLSISWRVYDSGSGPRLSWEWRESGVSIVDPDPARVGFGRELIERGLPYQLGATTVLEFGSGGIRCAIELPLTDRVAVLKTSDAGKVA